MGFLQSAQSDAWLEISGSNGWAVGEAVCFLKDLLDSEEKTISNPTWKHLARPVLTESGLADSRIGGYVTQC
jgi:hypothetical protein